MKTKSNIQAQHRTKKMPIKAWILSLASLVMMLYALIFFTSAGNIASDSIKKNILYRFKLQDIEWTEKGSGNLSDRVSPDLLWKVSGFKTGSPIFSYDMKEVEGRLLSIPWIESVQIRLKLNSGFAVEYVTRKARAVFIKDKKPWLVSMQGEPIAELGTALRLFDLPLISGFESHSEGLKWLDAIESELNTESVQIHEIALEKNISASKVEVLLEIKYESQNKKISAYFDDSIFLDNNASSLRHFIRLKQTVHYLIKNNILVSSVDLRAGQKVVVNVGKSL